MIQFTDVCKSYAKTPILKKLNFTIPDGQFVVLVGPSGCGKTTTLKTINRLIEPDSGTIFIDGKDIQATDKVELRRHIGYVIQQIGLFPNMTVAENICVVPKLMHYDKERCQKVVQELLALVQMENYADKYPSELSGGQQQRVALARALAPKPKLLLLDEPFSNLDVVLRESLAMNVRDILKRTNTTAILVTHDQNEAFALADKVGVMDKGKLVQWATPSELYHEPVSPFVAEFVGEGAMIDGIIKEGHVETALGDIYRRMEVYDESGQPQYCEYDYPNGTPIKVLVRPDDIVHDDESTQTALVVGRVFRGANYLYRLQLADGQTVLSLVASHHNHEIGSQIGILPILEHVVVFDEKDINATTWSEYDRSERVEDVR